MDVKTSGKRFIMHPVSPQDYVTARQVPGAFYDANQARWVAPITADSYKVLQVLGLLPNGTKPPPQGEVMITKLRNALVLESPPAYAKQCRAFPDRRFWTPGHGEHGAWFFSPTSRNVQHAIQAFPTAVWSSDAEVIKREVTKQLQISEVMREAKTEAIDGQLIARDFKFNTKWPPFKHQEHVFALCRDRALFALFMEMGTGKTRIMVDNACHLHREGKINAVLVICPNSVKSTWVEEIEQMAPEWSEHWTQLWSAHAKKSEREATEDFLAGRSVSELKWFVVNVEGLSTGRLLDKAMDFTLLHDTLMIVDESSRIKTPRAKRTKNIIKIGRKAKYRRIMSGTPVTQGPLDLYAQFRFLDPHILGFGSFFAFRNRYAVMGGFNNKQVIGYSNLEELVDLVDPYTYRVTRAECIDLPPKVFEKHTITLSLEQRRAYDQMKKDMVTDLGDKKISATIVLTQLLRLQQIVGGFLPVTHHNDLTMLEETHTEPIPGRNSKVDALVDLLTDSDDSAKVIIWARFRAEIAIIAETLRETFGTETVVEFHGGTSTEARTEARISFQDKSSPVRFFIGQTETGGLGITLTAASTVVYFSNSFSLESRLQSEDRAHRIGQDKTVTYVDLVAEKTLDAKLLRTLRAKKNLADMITGDDFMEWI